MTHLTPSTRRLGTRADSHAASPSASVVRRPRVTAMPTFTTGVAWRRRATAVPSLSSRPGGNLQRRQARRSGPRRARRESQATEVPPRFTGGAVRRPPAWPSTQARPHRARRRPHAASSSTSAVRRPQVLPRRGTVQCRAARRRCGDTRRAARRCAEDVRDSVLPNVVPFDVVMLMPLAVFSPCCSMHCSYRARQALDERGGAATGHGGAVASEQGRAATSDGDHHAASSSTSTGRRAQVRAVVTLRAGPCGCSSGYQHARPAPNKR